MGISISSAFATANSSANSTAVQKPQPVQPSTNNLADTVTLTESQQVYQLYNQGQQVSQIATTLSLPVEIVNNYLGITATTG